MLEITGLQAGKTYLMHFIDYSYTDRIFPYVNVLLIDDVQFMIGNIYIVHFIG